MRHRNILFGVGVGFVILLVAFGLLAGIYCRVHRQAIPVQIVPAKPVIALTFDDGPNSLYTPQVLDSLYEQQVPATFFLVGKRFSKNEPLLKEMVFSGHEIGNHTFSHPDLTTLNQQQIQQEFLQTEEELKNILPNYQIKYVRPPYGRYTEAEENAIETPFILWTIDSGDWKNPNAEEIYITVVGNIRNGDIIVFHDNNAETVKALKMIIPELKARGFQFVTVKDLLS